MPGAYKVVVNLLPPDATQPEAEIVLSKTFARRETTAYSADDAGFLAASGDARSFVRVWEPERWKGDVRQWLQERYGVRTKTAVFDESAPVPLAGLEFGCLFRVPYVLTSAFGEPRDYSAFGGQEHDRHEGADYDVLSAAPDSQEAVLCVYPGLVETVKSSAGYGRYVVVRHSYRGAPFLTWYCHLDSWAVTAGQVLQAGDAVGEIGATGNAYGEHVHFNVQAPGQGKAGYVVADVLDPEPYFPMHPHVVGGVVRPLGD